jgi:hypothetical protein
VRAARGAAPPARAGRAASRPAQLAEHEQNLGGFFDGQCLVFADGETKRFMGFNEVMEQPCDLRGARADGAPGVAPRLYKDSAHRIISADETLLCGPKQQFVIAPRGARRAFRPEEDKSENVTVLAAVTYDGTWLPDTFITQQGKQTDLAKWQKALDPGTGLIFQDESWTILWESFKAWLTHVAENLHGRGPPQPPAPPPPAAAAQPGRSHEQQRQMVREGRVPTGGPLTSVAATAAPRLPGVAAGGVSHEYRALLIMDSHNTRVHPECVAEAQRLGFDILLFPGAHK